MNTSSSNKKEKICTLILSDKNTESTKFCNLINKRNQFKNDSNCIEGYKCKDENSNIYIIKTEIIKHLNENPSESNIYFNDLFNYLNTHERINTILIFKDYLQNTNLTEIKETLIKLYELYPIDDFFFHVVLVIPNLNNIEVANGSELKENKIKEYKNFLLNIINDLHTKNNSLIIPNNFEILFSDISKNNNQEINQIVEVISKNKKMYKNVNEIFEKKLKKIEKIENINIYNYELNKKTTFEDINGSIFINNEIIEEFKEYDIEEKLSEVEEKIIDDNTKKFITTVYKKIIHKDKDNKETVKVIKDKPIDRWVEKEEYIFYDEKISEVEDDPKKQNGKITYNYTTFKKREFTDKNMDVTCGEPIEVRKWQKSQEITSPYSSLNHYRGTMYAQFKYIDKDGNVSYGQQFSIGKLD